MRVGVNVPNYGPGTRPDTLRRWARTAEALGYDLLMLSDHVVVTPDVAVPYPAPFYEPFTALSWLAGVTDRIRLGTSVVIVPYRHPLLLARMAANLNELSGGRLVLGVGAGWARQEFDALGVPFERRGALTDEHLRAVRAAWADEKDYRSGSIPIWVGGNSAAGIRRAVRLGDAWHPLRDLTLSGLSEASQRMTALAGELGRPVPALAPRILLRLTDSPLPGDDRRLGEGSIEQVVGDLEQLRLLGADTVVLDPYLGDPAETLHPQTAWSALAAVADHWDLNPDPDERSRG
jgi:alkanesulfonate monooxygenase SsuD/methylene tetrahydromethanopterin reductase-like flavin-dependent oxidoreductase (luciferase family)